MPANNKYISNDTTRPAVCSQRTSGGCCLGGTLSHTFALREG